MRLVQNRETRCGIVKQRLPDGYAFSERADELLDFAFRQVRVEQRVLNRFAKSRFAEES